MSREKKLLNFFSNFTKIILRLDSQRQVICELQPSVSTWDGTISHEKLDGSKEKSISHCFSVTGDSPRSELPSGSNNCSLKQHNPVGTCRVRGSQRNLHPLARTAAAAGETHAQGRLPWHLRWKEALHEKPALHNAQQQQLAKITDERVLISWDQNEWGSRRWKMQRKLTKNTSKRIFEKIGEFDVNPNRKKWRREHNTSIGAKICQKKEVRQSRNETNTQAAGDKRSDVSQSGDQANIYVYRISIPRSS